MPDQIEFRQAWSKFPTGVSVVTTHEPDGNVHGMTANGINSISLDPLLVMVCAGHNTNSHDFIKQSGRFAISILSDAQESIAEYFARRPENRTGDVEVSFSFTQSGAALVDDALASMDCKLVSEHIAGDHTIFIAEVEEIQTNSGNPLVYYESKFSRLS